MTKDITKKARLETRKKALAALKKQAMAQAIVSEVSSQVDINDPNYTEKIMNMIFERVVGEIINEE